MTSSLLESTVVLGMMLVAFASGAQPASAEGDLSKGKTLARSSACIQCHGDDGNARSTSFQPIPMLAGQPAEYLVAQMKAYADGTRMSSTKNFELMVQALGRLSESDFQDIAAYFEAQKRY